MNKPWTSWSAAACLIATGVLATAGARAADSLVAIGPDGDGVGRVVTPVAPLGAGVAIGDGSINYSGLAWSASDGRLYTVGSDSSGASSLTSFDPAAPTTLSTPVALGFGFFGGIASDGSGLFALGSDNFGDSSLYSVGASGATLLGALGVGFDGGLTYDTADHDFYAISANPDDGYAPNELSRIDLSGGAPVVTSLFGLGDGSLGFQGGLAYDAASDQFMVIGSDGFDNSSLYSFALGGGGTLDDLGMLDTGYYDAGLAFVSTGVVTPPPVPEPPAGLLLALAGISMLIAKRFGTRNHDVA